MDVNFPSEGIKLLSWQKKLLEDESRYIAICAGRGSGKTFGLVVKILSFAMSLYAQRASIQYRRVGHPVKIMWLVPKLEMSDEAINTILNLLPSCFKKNENYWLRTQASSRTLIILKPSAGIQIKFMSGWVGTSVRGATADAVVLDEVSFFGNGGDPSSTKKQTRDFEEYFLASVFPCTTRPFTKGRIYMASTPYYGGHFDRIITRILSREVFWANFSLHQVTYADNEFLSQDDINRIEEIAELYPIKYQCEFLAKLNLIYKNEGASASRIFSDDLINGVFLPSFGHLSKPPSYACAVDLGWQGADSTAVVVADVNNNLIVNIQLYETADAIKNASVIRQTREAFRIQPSKVIIDATGRGTEVLPYLSFTPTIFKFNEKTKNNIFNSLVAHMGNQNIIIPHPETFDFSTLPNFMHFEGQIQRDNFEVLYREMNVLQYWEEARKVGGENILIKKYNPAGNKQHDDATEALAMLSQLFTVSKTSKIINSNNNILNKPKNNIRSFSF